MHPEPSPDLEPRRSKGQKTRERVLDAAEPLFAERGFEGASLREIARRAGIQQPGLYNHFESKQALYAAVLDRALRPMAAAMQTEMRETRPGEIQTTLASVMTDILVQHPKMASLFQRALQGEPESLGNRLINEWLERLFGEALETMQSLGRSDLDRADLGIRIIAMFNLTTGYFLSQRVFGQLVGGDLTSPENIRRQKSLLDKIVRATLLD